MNSVKKYDNQISFFMPSTLKKISPKIFDRATLLKPSFGIHLYANYHVLKHPLTNLILLSFNIPKVLKSAAKIMEIGSQIKNLTPKNNLD